MVPIVRNKVFGNLLLLQNANQKLKALHCIIENIKCNKWLAVRVCVHFLMKESANGACAHVTDRVQWALEHYPRFNVVVIASFTGKRIDPEKFCARVGASVRQNNWQIICVLKEISPHNNGAMQRSDTSFALNAATHCIHSQSTPRWRVGIIFHSLLARVHQIDANYLLCATATLSVRNANVECRMRKIKSNFYIHSIDNDIFDILRESKIGQKCTAKVEGMQCLWCVHAVAVLLLLLLSQPFCSLFPEFAPAYISLAPHACLSSCKLSAAHLIWTWNQMIRTTETMMVFDSMHSPRARHRQTHRIWTPNIGTHRVCVCRVLFFKPLNNETWLFRLKNRLTLLRPSTVYALRRLCRECDQHSACDFHSVNQFRQIVLWIACTMSQSTRPKRIYGHRLLSLSLRSPSLSPLGGTYFIINFIVGGVAFSGTMMSTRYG